jgi:hypothetical protein
MSSRQEEKEARRKEREAQEAAAAKAAAAKQRLRLTAGVVVAVLAVGGIAAAVLAGGGDDGPDPSDDPAVARVAIPPVKITDLKQAAKTAKCELKEQLPNEGSDHVDKTVTTYKTNPPTSGPHNPTPAQDGEYDIGNEPAKEAWVHSLEHGRIVLQYAPGTSKTDQGKMSSLFNEDFSGGNGYHQLLLQNNTKMPFKFAAVAWTNYIGCPGPLDSPTIDALRAFRAKYVDKGPEIVP